MRAPQGHEHGSIRPQQLEARHSHSDGGCRSQVRTRAIRSALRTVITRDDLGAGSPRPRGLGVVTCTMERFGGQSPRQHEPQRSQGHEDLKDEGPATSDHEDGKRADRRADEHTQTHHAAQERQCSGPSP